MWAFAQLYYSQVLGLDFAMAGLALSVTMLWDAISDPLMGHISDNTRSRFGKRHPYILVGGIGVAVFFFLLWAVPSSIQSQWGLFGYLLLMNFMFRTVITIFMVPFGALGFEICTDYDQRSTLQSTVCIVSMLVNLLIPLSWVIFFSERDGVDGTHFGGNYFRMGLTFSSLSLFLVFFCLISTRRYIRDTRSDSTIIGNGAKELFTDIAQIFKDKSALIVFSFLAIAQFGGALVACWQSFIWIYYMKFSGGEKTFCHILGMLGFVSAAFLATPLSKKMDKKKAVCFGASFYVIGNLGLLLIFYTGFMGRFVYWRLPEWFLTFYNDLPAWMPNLQGEYLPVSVIVFAVFQAIFWMGPGILFPLATSMVADISEINKYNTGVLKDGSYSAVYTFCFKMTSALALFVQGSILGLIGFQEKSEVQTPEAVDRLVLITFLSGIVCAIIAWFVASRHKVTREHMEHVKQELAKRDVEEKTHEALL
jgi:GPH family glycoside/pentoside/hexuronide:cation symporter